MDITTAILFLCVIVQSDLWSGYWSKLLACGLGTVRTGLDGFRPVKVEKENTNMPTIQGP